MTHLQADIPEGSPEEVVGAAVQRWTEPRHIPGAPAEAPDAKKRGSGCLRRETGAEGLLGSPGTAGW